MCASDILIITLFYMHQTTIFSYFSQKKLRKKKIRLKKTRKNQRKRHTNTVGDKNGESQEQKKFLVFLFCISNLILFQTPFSILKV